MRSPKVQAVSEAWLCFVCLNEFLWTACNSVFSLENSVAVWREMHAALGHYGLCCIDDGRVLHAMLDAFVPSAAPAEVTLVA